MPVKFYTDSHIMTGVAVQARQRGIDIVRCQDVGMANAEDEEHLEYATKEGRTVISADADFSRINAQWQAAGKKHAGIIRLQQERKDNVGIIVEYIVSLNELIEGGAGTLEQDVYNQIIYL